MGRSHGVIDRDDAIIHKAYELADTFNEAIVMAWNRLGFKDAADAFDNMVVTWSSDFSKMLIWDRDMWYVLGKTEDLYNRKDDAIDLIEESNYKLREWGKYL